MEISYKKSYQKDFIKLQTATKSAAIRRISLFAEDPFHRQLNNHALRGEYAGFRSINITGDYRAIFRELSENAYEFVEFVRIGSHTDLYE